MTDLPSTVSLAGATTSAVGCPSTGQVAVAVSASRPSRVVPGRPGACTSASARVTEAVAPLASVLVTDLPTSALTRVTGPDWSTPSTLAVSTVPSRCAGDSTLLSETFTGTSTALFNRRTSRSSSAVTARALPGEPGAPAPGAAGAPGAAVAVGTVSSVQTATAALAETIRLEEREEREEREDMAVPHDQRQELDEPPVFSNDPSYESYRESFHPLG